MLTDHVYRKTWAEKERKKEQKNNLHSWITLKVNYVGFCCNLRELLREGLHKV